MKNHLIQRLVIFKELGYRYYFISCLFSTFALGISYVISAWLIVSHHNTVSAVVLGFFCFWLPSILFSPIAGVVADRFKRKNIIFTLDLLGGIISVLLAIALLQYKIIPFVYIILYLLVLGTMNAFYEPTMISFIRELVHEDDLLIANANLDFGYQAGDLLGMGVAGILAFLFGMSLSYFTIGILMFVACAFIYKINKRNLKSIETTQSASSISLKNMFIDFKKGIQYLIHEKEIRIIYWTQLFVMLSFMTAPVLLAPFAKNILHANSIEFGWIEAGMTLGMILGSILLTYFSIKFGVGRIIFIGASIISIGLFLFSINKNIYLATLMYFFIGFGVSCWVLIITEAQKRTDIEFQGRVQSCFNVVLALFVIVVFSLMSLMSHHITIQHIYWFIVAVSIIPLFLIVKYKSIWIGTNALT